MLWNFVFVSLNGRNLTISKQQMNTWNERKKKKKFWPSSRRGRFHECFFFPLSVALFSSSSAMEQSRPWLTSSPGDFYRWWRRLYGCCWRSLLWPSSLQLSLSLAPSLYLFFCHSLIKGPIFSPFHHPPFIPSLFLLSSHPCPCLRSCCSFHPTEIPFHISMFLFSSFACPVMEPSGQCQTIFSFFFFFGEMAWVEVELYKEKKKRKWGLQKVLWLIFCQYVRTSR